MKTKKFNLKKASSKNTKIAMAAHWRGANIPDDYCYMHVSRPGYTGISSVHEDRVNVVLVVDQNSMRGEKPDSFYECTVMKNPLMPSLLMTYAINSLLGLS